MLQNSSDAYFLLAAVADFANVVMHGFIGHRAMVAPLRRTRLFSTRAFGDEDMNWRIFATTWHIVTAAFASMGFAALLLAMGLLQGTSLPLTLSATHALFLVVSLSFVARRVLIAFRRPIPVTAALCMTASCLANWLGTL